MINNFIFNTTARIINEIGGSRQLGKLCTELVGQKTQEPILFITDPHILKLGLAHTALESLKDAGLSPLTYSDIVADPPEDVILKAVALGKEHKVCAVIGFGGGSSMDAAKLAALLIVSDKPLADIYGIGQAGNKRLPLILVPTTAGTGSEVTPISIVTTGENTKSGVVDPILLPDIALLDAELTLELPPAVTAATGIDAMVHAIEAYTSKHKKNPLSDALAKEALKLLGANIRTACKDGHNKHARANMLLGSMLAGQAFANSPVAAVHALAYPLGGHFHVPHGLSNSLVLPPVLRFNLSHAESLYAELARIIFPDIPAGSNQSLATTMIDRFESLIGDIGLVSRLRDVGIRQKDIPLLARDALKQSRLLINNPREVTYEDALALYQSVY